MTYNETVEAVIARISSMRHFTLADLIKAESYDTFVPGRVDMVYCEQDLFMSIVPCHGKMIMARDRYDIDSRKYIAEYAIYNETGKNTFGDEYEPNAEVILSEAVYKFDHVCDKTFANRALAIADAVKEIYKEDHDNE